MKRLKILLASTALTILSFGLAGIIAPATSSASSLLPAKAGTCEITGVPKTVEHGLYVTPTIVVNNVGSVKFTSLVTVNEQLLRNGSGRGGEVQESVTVPVSQSVEFKGGKLLAEVGYKIKITASSTSPRFTCETTAKVN